MAFDDFEITNEGGKPIALYEFRHGNTYWRYCTADEDKTVGLDENDDPAIWLAGSISDEGVTQGGSDQHSLRVVVPYNFPVAELFRNDRPTGKVWLTVRAWHEGDPDEETPLRWSGTISNLVGIDEGQIQLSCRSISASYDRQGLRLAWGRMCPHVLYSSFGCTLDKDDFAYAREVATVDGRSFTCTTHAEPAEGSFTGGFMEWVRDDGSLERRGIEYQNGNDFTILGNAAGLEVGLAVTLYPGCARSTTVCKLFNNLPNHGGFPHLPGKSPFDGTPVF